MGTVLLLDVDGVLQFPNAGFAEMIEGRYRWRHGYGLFLGDLFDDPGYLLTLVGEGDFLEAVGPVLERHVHGLDPDEFLRLWLRHGSVPNRPLLARLPEVRASRIVLAPTRSPTEAAISMSSTASRGGSPGRVCRIGWGRANPTRCSSGLLRTVGVAASDCLFVDDNPECVASATAEGIDSITFTTNLALTDELIRRGLLEPGVGG